MYKHDIPDKVNGNNRLYSLTFDQLEVRARLFKTNDVIS